MKYSRNLRDEILFLYFWITNKRNNLKVDFIVCLEIFKVSLYTVSSMIIELCSFLIDVVFRSESKWISAGTSSRVFFLFNYFFLFDCGCSSLSVQFFNDFMGFFSWEYHGFSPDIGSLDLDGSSVRIENRKLFFRHFLYGME